MNNPGFTAIVGEIGKKNRDFAHETHFTCEEETDNSDTICAFSLKRELVFL